MLRANLSSVLPPKFRENSLHSADTGTHLLLFFPKAAPEFRYRFPVTREKR